MVNYANTVVNDSQVHRIDERILKFWEITVRVSEAEHTNMF